MKKDGLYFALITIAGLAILFGSIAYFINRNEKQSKPKGIVEVKINKGSVILTPTPDFDETVIIKPDTGYAVPFDSAYVKCNRKHVKINKK